MRSQRLCYQKGQALIYGIFVLIGGLAATFFLFNTGQLSSEKTKLVNTADAVAYSAGIMHARALDFGAYSNRALVANEVLVAQMVSLSSWAQYAETHAENLESVFPDCASSDYYTLAYAAAFNYGPLYAAMCKLTVIYAGEYIEQIAGVVPDITNALVAAVSVNKAAVELSQDLLHVPSFRAIRGGVMQQVADANYAGDGTVTVDPVGLMPSNRVPMTDDWSGFTEKYSGDDRGRFAEVAKLAAYSDDFVKERSWTATALLPPPSEWKCVARGRKNEVRRRGGTELIGFDEWKAEDTESFWKVRNAGKPWQIRCRGDENPIGWGEQQAHPNGRDQDESDAHLGGSPSTNPDAHGNASSDAFTGYTGLPSFYDLSDAMRDQPDPRLKFSVRVTRSRNQTNTSDGRSRIGETERLNAYDNDFARGSMVAVATSEVYFERPFDHRANLFGQAQSPATPREIGSLFNPYWQVHLVESPVDIAAQQAWQRAVLP